MEGVEYTAEITLKNVPQDYKSSGAGCTGEYDGNVCVSRKIHTKGRTCRGWR